MNYKVTKEGREMSYRMLKFIVYITVFWTWVTLLGGGLIDHMEAPYPAAGIIGGFFILINLIAGFMTYRKEVKRRESEQHKLWPCPQCLSGEFCAECLECNECSFKGGEIDTKVSRARAGEKTHAGQSFEDLMKTLSPQQQALLAEVFKDLGLEWRMDDGEVAV